MIKIKEIAYIAYPVTDLARSRAFYEGTLGLAVAGVFGEGACSWIEYDVGGQTLAITNVAPEMWKPSFDGASVALEVDDFGSAVAHLRSAGVGFSMEPSETPGCHFVVFRDPDENGLILHQRKA